MNRALASSLEAASCSRSVAAPPERRTDDVAGAWEQVSNKDGIVVQRRSVEGYKLKEFLGRGVIDAPIGRVLAVIRDANRRAEWMPSLRRLAPRRGERGGAHADRLSPHQGAVAGRPIATRSTAPR